MEVGKLCVEERAELVSHLAMTRDGLEGLTRPLSVAQWVWQPSAEAWGPALIQQLPARLRKAQSPPEMRPRGTVVLFRPAGEVELELCDPRLLFQHQPL